METRRQTIRIQHTNQVPIHKYRRNHKLQSCEPCRKSKVACNHSVPCSRCVRRRRVDECYYHPNPLTRNRREGTSTMEENHVLIPALSNTVLSSSVEQPRIGGDSETVTTLQEYNYMNNLLLPRAGSAPPLANHAEVSKEKHGFLGFTSDTSIMTEDLMQLGVASTGLEQVTAVHAKPIMNERVASGCRILSFFQNRALIDRGIDLFFKSVECIHIHCGEFIVREWLSRLWTSHGETLSSQNPEWIRQLCQLLCQNTATPLVFDGNTTARQWILSATGDHIRWGVLAIIANYVGSYVMISESTDPFFQEFNVNRESLLSQVLNISDVCMALCRECDALDDTFICALFEQYNITTYTKGEACYAAYSIGAEVNSALVAMGLHQEIKSDSQVPFFLAELRKRLRALIYKAEISIATFLGRPPRLSHRYMNLDPPLDLIDSQLFSEDPRELAVAIARLDEQGYNRDGEIRHVSWVRSSTSFTARREDILELSLGNYTPEEVRQKAIDIQRKTEDHWSTLPGYMSSLRESIFGLETNEIFDLHFRNVFRQGPQVNSLLLHRVLMRKAGADPADLIRTAQAILSDVMRTYKRIEMSAAASFIYFLAVHGMRSAVILAIELLKQEQLPAHPNKPLLPRSRTIQDLSIFAAKLDDLDTVFGDKDLCKKGQKVISRILDKILSPPKSSSPQCHTLPMQTQDSGTNAIASYVLQNTIPENSTVIDDFSYDMVAPICGADHEFRLWLESMGGQDWDL